MISNTIDRPCQRREMPELDGHADVIPGAYTSNTALGIETLEKKQGSPQGLRLCTM
jgi:hypothetical protein